jgi:hypothetical protein
MTIQQPNSRERYRVFELPNGTAEVWLERAGPRVTIHTASPNGGGSGNWERCQIDSCLGQAVAGQSMCLRHADIGTRDQYLNDLGSDNRGLSLTGVEVNQELIDAILRSPLVDEGRVRVPISFWGAEVDARLDFEGLTFESSFTLNGAIVRGPAAFRNCTFKGLLDARFAYFDGGPPSFTATNFSEGVDFSCAHAERVSIGFTNCSFTKPLAADGIAGTLLLEQCHFESDLVIRGAKPPMIVLRGCSVDGELDVADTYCASFQAERLQAPAAHQIGPLHIDQLCKISPAQFGARVRIDVEADDLDLSGVQLSEGGHVLVERARVSLDQLSTGRSLRVSGLADSAQTLVILSLQDADTGFMSFAHVDMSRCVFYDSHNLGDAVIESTVTFARTPSWPYTRRRCVADEFAWRQHTGGFRSWRWNLPGTRVAGEDHTDPRSNNVVELPELRASQVAAVYRNLRRSFEARSDAPGAADFYYGEMEMRRYDSESGIAERGTIWLYWLLSGYALRASRAFAWLLALMGASTVAMIYYGFAEEPATYLDGLIFSLRAALPGLQSDRGVTTVGELVEIGLTLTAPLVFALALFALRGRVKR